LEHHLLTIGGKQAVQLVFSFLESIALELQNRLDFTMAIQALLVGDGQFGQGNHSQYQTSGLQHQA